MEQVKDSTYFNQEGVTKYLNSYNSNQDLEEQIIYFGSTKDTLFPKSRTTYTYEGGKLSEKVEYKPWGDKWMLVHKSTFSYQNNQCEELQFDGDDLSGRLFSTYGSDDILLERVESVMDGDQWIPAWRDTYKYDEQLRVIEEIKEMWFHDPDDSSHSEWHINSKAVSSYGENTTIEVTYDGNEDKCLPILRWSVRRNGCDFVEETYSYVNDEWVLTDVCKGTYLDNVSTDYREWFSFDDKNNPIGKGVYEYDNEGRLISRIFYTFIDGLLVECERNVLYYD